MTGGPGVETTNALESPAAWSLPLTRAHNLPLHYQLQSRRGRRKDFRSSGSRSGRWKYRSGIMCRALVLLIALLPSTLPQLTRPTDVPSCHLPAGRAAVCVPIAACSHLASLVGNLRAPLPRDVALLLRDSFFCSGTGSAVQVCCPVEGRMSHVFERPRDSMTFLPGLVSPSSARPQVRDRPNCAIQDGPAECVAYNVCSPFVQLL